jgi:hypothetical protein
MDISQNINAERLLIGVKHLIDHQSELERIKGERFNIFSILGMERYENATHSAFLAELLNPLGTHLMGSVFLENFLKSQEINHIDISTAKVVVEHHIGYVNNDYSQGGRVDIYIYDSQNNSVSIENKIDANDQFKQIERYCNHNKGKNKVVYLTKEGRLPNSDSYGSKQPNIDFLLCSYRTDIIQWLEFCQKEAMNSPILRESIKQYLILVKKITHTMEAQSENKLVELMLQYFDEAEYIADNFTKIKLNIGEEVRRAVAERVQEILGDKYWVEVGAPITNVYAQIWLGLNRFQDAKLHFGIESFNGSGWHGGQLFMGVYHNAGGSRSKFANIPGNSNTNAYWVDQYKLPELNGFPINFKNSGTLRKYHADLNFRKDLVVYISDEIIRYVKLKSPLMDKFLETELLEKP